MYAEVHFCGIFSPTNVSLNMSVKKVITVFLQYLINSFGVLFGPGANCFLKILRCFLSLLLLSPGSFLLHFVLGWILILFSVFM